MPVVFFLQMAERPHTSGVTGDGWVTTPLPETGVKVAPITGLVGAIKRDDYENIHSLLFA
jgi:hypothetical protein